MRALLGTLLSLAVVAAASGCGSKDPHQVRAKVEQFVQAVATRDATTVCEQVLAPSLTNRFAVQGLSCEEGMKVFMASVRNPTLSVGHVNVKGGSASATVLAGARCQRFALAQLFLVKTSTGWRISGESKGSSAQATC